MTGFAASLEDGDNGNEDKQLVGVAKVLGPSWSQLPSLTVGLLGVQVMWSIEMSYASPYLLSLGLSKSHMAIVFLAGPISGLVVQPLVGAIADNSRSRFGRRRPYMLLGSLICASAMLLLGFTSEFVSIFFTTGTDLHGSLTMALAIWAIYCIDFSVNAVQSADRALLVDTLPKEKQALGIAWSAGMLGVGSVVGFFIGNVDLTQTFSMFGKTELQVLSVLGSLLLLFGHGITAFCVKEKILISRSHSQGLLGELKEIWLNIFTLPRVLRQICIIQFFAWIAWFPLLFYATVYVGDLHRRLAPEPLDDNAAAALEAEGTRLGTRALFYSALLTLLATTILPHFVSKSGNRRADSGSHLRNWEKISSKLPQMHMCELWAFSHLVLALCMAATLIVSTVGGATLLITVTGFSWAVTQWAPVALMAEEIVSDSQSAGEGGAIRLVETQTDRIPMQVVGVEDQDEGYPLMESHAGDNDGFSKADLSVSSRESSLDGGRPTVVMGNRRAQLSRVDVPILAADGLDPEHHEPFLDQPTNPNKSLRGKAGLILGIGNIFVVIPQFLVTGLSSLIFAVLEPDKSVLHGHHPGNVNPNSGTNLSGPGGNGTSMALVVREAVDNAPNSVAVILRIGGITAAIAFVLAWRLAKELKSR